MWVIRNGQLIPKHLAPPPVVQRSELSAPMLIRDGMEPTWNPVNGQRYDSKRAYEKAVRAAGCEIVGNEKLKASPRPQAPDPVQDIKAAIEIVESRAPTPKRKAKRGRV